MTLPRPHQDLMPNTTDYENLPFIKATGFREYDARWLFEKEINLSGIHCLGAGLATLLYELGSDGRIVVGHDFRSYSQSIKMSLITGLMAGGAEVTDIGLALSPMAYFAQFALDIPAVAMVTASHNDNGWTGVKMGAERPCTFGLDEMKRLKEIVMSGACKRRAGGSDERNTHLAKHYMDDLANRPKFIRRIKAVVATGNGTAGAFVPELLRRVGIEVIELDTELDHSFPNYNPNPEDMVMLHAVRDKISATGADIGLAFDGDGDRCGVIDNEGEEIFADKAGLMLARDLSMLHSGAHFIVDVKSTGLFATDAILKQNNVTVDYWKTGHSYIKRRVQETDALAGFEKSGHFFFNTPLGRGYDDGLVAALAILDMLERNRDKSFADLRNALPISFQSPTMSPHCADEIKYDIVDKITSFIENMKENDENIAGQKIISLVTVNGIRVVVEDGSWGLVRASSNKPELVVVVESTVSEAQMREMFKAIDAIVRLHPEVGDYNQTLD